MQAKRARLVLLEPFRERQTASFVAERTGARVVPLPIMPRGSGVDDYVAFVDDDVRTLAGAIAP